jgi:4-carboxymuconolactone decarboxylase
MPRLPEITSRDDLPEGERHVWDYVEKSRGRIGLPYSVFMHHPELALRKLEVGHFVRFDTSLPRNVSELAICTAAREFDCRFEWAMHAPAAERAGISEAAMQAIAHRDDLDALSDEEALPIRLARPAPRGALPW